jgi:hypothetical protein
MPEQPGGQHVQPPAKSIMTACEVLTWIALRRAITQEQLGSLFKISVGRWACVPADAVLEALEARAGISGDGPYCAIRWAKDPHYSDSSVNTAFSPGGRAMLRSISRQHRRETGELLSFAALARLLREEIADDEKTSDQLEDAKAQLRDRVAGGLLVAHGISLEPDGSRSAAASVQAIPATVFMHPAMAITEWDEAHADTIKTAKEWHNQRLPRFGNIQFKTVEVLAQWAPRAGLTNNGGKGSPSLSDSVTCWMRAYVMGCNDAGKKPKRDGTLKQCQDETGTTYRLARAAWDALPAEWKNPPRKAAR